MAGEGGTLRKLLSEVAEEFYGEKLKSLHFLLSDVLTSNSYDESLQIFQELLTSGYITCADISLLYDIIRITGHFIIEGTIKKFQPNCPNLKSWRPTGVLTRYRVMMYKLTHELLKEDLSNIKFCYSVRQNASDVWSVFLRLEKAQKIGDSDEQLNRLKSYINAKAGKLIDDHCARRSQERSQGTRQNLPTQDSGSDGPRILVLAGSGSDTCDSGGDRGRIDVADCIVQPAIDVPDCILQPAIDVPDCIVQPAIDVPDCIVQPDLTTIELLELSREVGIEWQSLAVYLRFSSARISHFKSDNPDNIQTAIFTMLDAWHKSASGLEKSRRTQLTEALRKTERNDLAEKVESGII